jgi:inosine/xanthosine triphosphate pyrophosphatase family protein
LLIASTNPGKLVEVREILAGPGFELVSHRAKLRREGGP